MVLPRGIEDFDHIRRLPLEIGTETGTEIAAVIAGKGVLQISLSSASRTLEAVGQDCRTCTHIGAGVEHRAVVQPVAFQVVTVYLHQSHTEIPTLRMQHFGRFNRFGHAARLAGQRTFHHADGIGVELAFDTGNGLQGIGMDVFATLLCQLGKQNPLRNGSGLGLCGSECRYGGQCGHQYNFYKHCFNSLNYASAKKKNVKIRMDVYVFCSLQACV